MGDMLDIQKGWLNVARKLQFVSKNSGNQGLAVLAVRILIDELGNPICWTTPTVNKIEPKGNKDEILARFFGENL